MNDTFLFIHSISSSFNFIKDLFINSFKENIHSFEENKLLPLAMIDRGESTKDATASKKGSKI